MLERPQHDVGHACGGRVPDQVERTPAAWVEDQVVTDVNRSYLQQSPLSAPWRPVRILAVLPLHV